MDPARSRRTRSISPDGVSHLLRNASYILAPDAFSPRGDDQRGNDQARSATLGVFFDVDGVAVSNQAVSIITQGYELVLPFDSHSLFPLTLSGEFDNTLEVTHGSVIEGFKPEQIVKVSYHDELLSFVNADGIYLNWRVYRFPESRFA
jgi:hypothetical protein